MGRPNKPHYWQERRRWVTKIGGVRVTLAEGPKEATRKEALAEFHRLMAQRQDSPASPSASVAVILDTFLDYSRKRHEPATYQFYRMFCQSLVEAFGSLQARQIKPYHLDRWVAEHEAARPVCSRCRKRLDAEATACPSPCEGKPVELRWNPSTRFHAVATIQTAFNWAVKRGYLPENPIRHAERGRKLFRLRSITESEKSALLDHWDPADPFTDFLVCLRDTGCRPSEARRITVDMFHRDIGAWVIPSHRLREDGEAAYLHKTAKRTRKPRIIMLGPDALAVTLKLAEQRQPGQHLFLNSRGRPWTKNAVRMRMRRAKAKLGLAKDVTSYGFRHAWATQGLALGESPALIAEQLGHADLSMLANYAHLDERLAELRAAVIRVSTGDAGASAPPAPRTKGKSGAASAKARSKRSRRAS